MRTLFTIVVFLLLCGSSIAQTVGGVTGGVRNGASRSGGTSYFFANAGSDSGNTCKVQATPCQTIGMANSLSYNSGDVISFKGGDNFTDACLSLTNSNVSALPARPVTVTSYGSGAWTLTASCTGAAGAVTIDGASVILQNCILVGPSPTLLRAGVWIKNTMLPGALSGVTVRNCDISGFTYVPTDFGADVFITGYPGNGITGLQILDNNLHGLSGATSIEDNGLSGFGNGTNITATVQGNIVYNIGGNSDGMLAGSQGSGMLLAGHTGSLSQFNIAHDIGGNTTSCGGPTGSWMAGSANTTIRFTESYDVQPAGLTPGNASSSQTGCDWEGFDMDVATTNGLVQYNYSHDNAGAGYLFFYDPAYGSWGPNTTRYSISENDNGLGYLGFGCISFLAEANMVVPSMNAYNNTCWNNTVYVGNTPPFAGNKGAPIFGIQLSGAFNGIIANNVAVSRKTTVPGAFYGIYGNESGGAATTTAKWANNEYYSLNGGGAQFLWFNTLYSDAVTFYNLTGQESGSFSFEPPFTGSPPAGACSWTPSLTSSWPPSGCPSPYTLTSGSDQSFLLLADNTSLLLLADGVSAMCLAPLCNVNYRNNGLDLTQAPYSQSVGTRDYYANAIPGGNSCYNIGAFGLCP